MGLFSKFTKKTTNTAVEEATRTIKEKAKKYRPLVIGVGSLIFCITAWRSYSEQDKNSNDSMIFIQNNNTTIYFNKGDE